MKYSEIEGLEKKDSFKKGFLNLVKKTSSALLKNGFSIVPQSLGEPASLIDFRKEDFYLAFKTDGVGTKSLIADTMAKKGKNVAKLYSGLGIDLIASNVNDLICLGATPIALSDEIAAGDYHTFTNIDLVKGLYKGFEKGCNEAGITIPSGESPTLIDIVNKNSISITGSAIGIIKPKEKAIFGQKLKEGDRIFGLSSSGIHTNGLSLARKLVEKLPQGYFTMFKNKTIGEALLIPTRIYVQPILEMLKKGVDIHYMTHISGSSFKKIMRAKKELTYVINYLPKPPEIMTYLSKLGSLPQSELFQTWNMGIGFVIFAPLSEKIKIENICTKFKIKVYNMGFIKKGKRQVVIKPHNIIYEN